MKDCSAIKNTGFLPEELASVLSTQIVAYNHL